MIFFRFWFGWVCAVWYNDWFFSNVCEANGGENTIFILLNE